MSINTNNQSQVQRILYEKQNQKAISREIKLYRGGRNMR